MKLFILILITITFTDAYPNGASSDSCNSMIPGHNIDSQTCQANYIVQSDKTEFTPKDIIQISVRGATENDFFKGFLLVARTQASNKIVGTWTVTDNSTKTVNCNDVVDSALTHTSSVEKNNVNTILNLPDNIGDEKINIKLTIVKSFDHIYVDCFSHILTVKQTNILNNETKNETNELSKEMKTKVSWNVSENSVFISMNSSDVEINQWRSIGFSPDKEMGDEYVFICQVLPSGATSLRIMHTKPGKTSPRTSNKTVAVHRTSYEDGNLSCEFSFDTSSVTIDGEPQSISINADYYLLYASGKMKNETKIGKHDTILVSPITYQLQNTENLDLDNLPTSVSSPISTLSVGTTQNYADATIAWKHENGVTTVKMLIENLKPSQWFAMALSQDNRMGEDHVFTCELLSNNEVSARRFINPDGHSKPILFNSSVHFNVIQTKFENGLVYCDFNLSNFDQAVRKKRQISFPDISLETFYQTLVASGNLDESNKLLRHSKSSRQALRKTVSLSQSETISYRRLTVRSSSTSLMKAHGLIMIFTWIALVSTGIIIARYFKESWTGKKFCGEAVWFALHRLLMCSVSLLTLISFILIVFYKQGTWTSKSSQPEFAHSIVGIFAVTFAIIQPFMALFRCHPNGAYRFVFNYAHAIVGLSAFLLSIAAILLAMFFNEFQFQATKQWYIMVGWSSWLIFLFILFELIEIFYHRFRSEDDVDSYDMTQSVHRVRSKSGKKFKGQNKNEHRLKLILLLLHVVVAFGLALTLMVLVDRS